MTFYFLFCFQTKYLAQVLFMPPLCLSKPVMSNTIATSHMWLVVIYFVAILKVLRQKKTLFQKNLEIIFTKFQERYQFLPSISIHI